MVFFFGWVVVPSNHGPVLVRLVSFPLKGGLFTWCLGTKDKLVSLSRRDRAARPDNLGGLGLLAITRLFGLNRPPGLDIRRNKFQIIWDDQPHSGSRHCFFV